MPELNDIGQWTMRRSEVADFKRCPHKWYLRYVMGLRAPPPPDRPISLSGVEYDPEDNLWLGTQWHDVMEYGLGSVVGAGPLPTAEMIVRVHEAARARAVELRQEYPLLPIWFGDRTLTPWAAMLAGLDMVAEVAATEVQLSMPLSYISSAELRWPDLLLVGTLDGIIKDRWGNPWIMEHKTTSGSVRPEGLAEAYRLDEQATCYTMLAQASGYDVMGVFLDAVRKSEAERTKAPIAGHTLITRPQAALDLYRQDLRWVLNAMAEMATEGPEAAHRVANPVGGQGCYCPFVRLCEAKIQGEGWEDVVRGRYESGERQCGT